jgi:hypothetical protein
MTMMCVCACPCVLWCVCVGGGTGGGSSPSVECWHVVLKSVSIETSNHVRHNMLLVKPFSLDRVYVLNLGGTVAINKSGKDILNVNRTVVHQQQHQKQVNDPHTQPGLQYTKQVNKDGHALKCAYS